MRPETLLGILVVAAGIQLTGCEPRHAATGPAGKSPAATDLVWAVNVGGPAYEGIDGTQYESEAYVTGGAVGQMETVKGSQDPVLYQSYREGDVEVSYPIEDGIYDVTFHFAEPREFESGERLFDAFIEGRQVIDDLTRFKQRIFRAISRSATVPANVKVSLDHFRAFRTWPINCLRTRRLASLLVACRQRLRLLVLLHRSLSNFESFVQRWRIYIKTSNMFCVGSCPGPHGSGPVAGNHTLRLIAISRSDRYIGKPAKLLNLRAVLFPGSNELVPPT